MRVRKLLVVGVLLVAGACGGTSTSPSSTSGGSSSSGNSGSGGSGGTSTANGSVAFKVDGVQNAASLVTATYTAGILAIGATDTSHQTTLGLALSGSTTGTYTLGQTSATNALLHVGNPAQGWQAGVGFGSGSVTVTTFTATSAVGTFSFTMVPTTGTGATGNKAVTEGTFNVVIR
jgi:hypothetical protein